MKGTRGKEAGRQRAKGKRRNRQGERDSETPPALFMGVARVPVGRAFNVKPVLSFTRFKGAVTARNHAARVRTFPGCPFHFGIP